MEETTVQPPRPKPYKIDLPIHKVLTVDEDGEKKFLFRHDFARLDASNVSLLLTREKDTKRVTERMSKGRSRQRIRSDDADRAFYLALVQGGGWRPYGLEPYKDKELIEPSMAQFYRENLETGIWKPGWMDLAKPDMENLTVEKMSEAIDAWFRCSGKNIGSGTIDFMFEKGGIMRIALAIGDPDEPAYSLPFDMRRPDSKRRSKFKEDFAYAIDNTKGGVGNVETVIDLRQGISFFDEYFATIPDDHKYSQVLFTDRRSIEQGATPRPISAVPPPEGEQSGEEDLPVRPYSDDLRDEVIRYLNPNFKVEVAAATIQAFKRTDQE